MASRIQLKSFDQKKKSRILYKILHNVSQSHKSFEIFPDFQVISKYFKSFSEPYEEQWLRTVTIPQHHHTYPDLQNLTHSKKSSHIVHL